MNFPILASKESIPWEVIAAHEKQAMENHGQTIKRLAERGGLDWTEALAVLEDRRYTKMNVEEAKRIVLLIVTESIKINSKVDKNASYINPIPYVDAAKKFEMRIKINLDTVTGIDQAKGIVADYIQNMPKSEIVKALSCETFPVYPED